MTTYLMPTPKQQFFAIAGIPLVGGKVYTYAAGTTTPKATYTDSDGTQPQTNPIVLNARGEPANAIFWNGNYRVDVRDALGNLVYTVDNFSTDQTLSQLTNAGGASIVGFIQGSANAVPRTVQDRLRDTISIKDFGAKGDGSDDTGEIQAAIDYVGNSGGGTVFIPPGSYSVTTLSLSKPGVFLRGAGWTSSNLVGTSPSSKIVNVTASSCGIDQLHIAFSGATPPTVDGIGLYCKGNDCNFTNFKVENAGIGVKFENGNVAMMSNFEIITFSQAGIYLNHWIDLYCSTFAIQASVGAAFGQIACIYLGGNSEAVIMSNADILSGNNGLKIDGCAYSFFTNLYLDSTISSAMFLNSSNLNRFTNVWASGGRTGSGFSGIDIQNSAQTQFVNCISVNNGGHGAHIGTGCSKIGFDTTVFDSNSLNAGNGVCHGLSVEPGISNWSATNSTFRNGQFPGKQGYGIFVNPGAGDNYTISGSTFEGNLTGPVFDAGTGTNKKIFANNGYSPDYTAPAFLGAWGNYGAASNLIGYIKDENGFVHLRGMMKNGAIPSTAFNLPVGFRPVATEDFGTVSGGAFGYVYVTSTGDVVVQAGNNNYVSLAGLSFKAA